MEEILKKLLAGQEFTNKKLENMENKMNALQDDIQNIKETTLPIMQNDIQNMKGNTLPSIQYDIKNILEAVNRIENHQEESVMSMLRHIKKQGDSKDGQIQVLNKRLFNVESSMEQAQQ